MNPLFRIDFSISDSLKIVRKSVLIYETIIYSLQAVPSRTGDDTAYDGQDKHFGHKPLLSGPKVFRPVVKPNHFSARKVVMIAWQ